MPEAQQDLVDFLAKLKLSKAKKHLEAVDCCTLAAVKGLKANDLKAIGFRSEVRSRLQKHIADEAAEADYKEEESFVTVDEEEEAIENKAVGNGGKKKKSGKKGGAKAGAASSAAHTPVPGEGGEAMEASFVEFLTRIGLKGYIGKFQENHLTSLESCKLMTKSTLISSLNLPDAQAGLILSEVYKSPGASQQARRLPELHHDLAMVVSRMNISEADRQSVRARLAVTDVLSVADAQAKRFAMMNEVGLSCDEATELGKLLDSAPANGGGGMQHNNGGAMGGWPPSNGYNGAMSVGGRY